MILRLLHAGSAKRGALDEATRDYQKRLGRVFRIEERFVKASRERERAKALADEAERLRGQLKPRDHLVALCVEGKAISSEQWAERLEGWMQQGHTAVCFALGSADGLDAGLKSQAAERLSFGPLTLPHDLARLVLWEQLYRANSILRGAPYHH